MTNDTVYVLHDAGAHIHAASNSPAAIRAILDEDFGPNDLTEEILVTRYRDGKPDETWNGTELPDELNPVFEEA